MKKHSSIYIIFIFLILTTIIVAILPSGQFIDGNFTYTESNMSILKQMLEAPINGFIGLNDGQTISYTNSGSMQGVVMIALLVSSIYMFTKVTLESEVISNFLKKHIITIEKHNNLFIVTLIIFFTFCAFTHGMYETTIALAPAIFLILKHIGYQPIYGIKIILYSTSIGYMGSTINPFATGLASSLAGTTLNEQFMLRMIIFLCLFTYTLFHLLHTKEKYSVDNKSILSSVELEDNTNIKSRIGLSFGLFITPFLILSYSFLPMALPFQLDTYQLIVLFIILAIAMGLINDRKVEECLDTILLATKDVMPIIIVLSVSRGIYAMLFNTGVDNTIIHYLLTIIDGQNPIIVIFLTSVFYMIISLFISSSSAVAYLSIPLLSPVYQSIGLSSATLVTVYQTSIGLLHVFSITSVVVITLLSAANISYKHFLKEIYSYVITLYLISYVIIFIAIL